MLLEGPGELQFIFILLVDRYGLNLFLKVFITQTEFLMHISEVRP